MVIFGQPSIGSARLSELLGAASMTRSHRVGQHMLGLITLGHGAHTVDFVEYRCRPGTVFWARPGQFQRFSAEPGLDATLVTVDPVAVEPIPELAPLLDDPFAASAWHPGGEDADAIVTEMAQLALDCMDPAATTALLRHEVAVVLLRLARLHPPGAGLRLRFLRELERSFRRTRRVEEYAERLDCSVRTLTRACLSANGRSAKQVVDDRVTLEAKRLLAGTDAPISAIGDQLGFGEPTNFSRFFTRETGCTPGEFRVSAR
jgi:AraC-like DNA-binding protein